MTTAEEPAPKPTAEAKPAASAKAEATTAKAEAPAAARESKLPKIEIVKPKRWDLIAGAVLAAGMALSGANLQMAIGEDKPAISGGVTGAFVTIQLVICLVGLMVLGKTAKEGTIWGNLFSVGACVVGMSGVLLASALWALA